MDKLGEHCNTVEGRTRGTEVQENKGLTRNTENIYSTKILGKAAEDDPKLGDAVDVESDFHDCFGRWWEDEIKEDFFENKNHMKYEEENHCKVTWKNVTGNGDLTLIPYSNDNTRDSSLYSLHDQLIKNHLHPGPYTMQARLDKMFTRTLTMFTILSIMFLFWLQNSPYHIGGHSQPKLKGK